MKVVVQRCGEARVEVDGEVVGAIQRGFLLLVCFEKGDGQETYLKAARKILALRIFEDSESEKMDCNIQDIQGQILAVSQFTLSWDGKKGHRPSFDGSLPPTQARVFFKLFCEALREKVPVERGRFGEWMDVYLHNQGPVTFHLNF